MTGDEIALWRESVTSGLDEERGKVAFVDESLPDCSTYILAATICDEDQVEVVRGSMSALRLSGQRKVHWHDENEKRRAHIAEALSHTPARHLAVVRSGLGTERPERQRKKCLERLLYELSEIQVVRLTLESRGNADNRQDRNSLDSLRARKVITSELRIDHVPGPSEPMLWLPDAICGAIVQDRAGDSSYLSTIRGGAEIMLIQIDAG